MGTEQRLPGRTVVFCIVPRTLAAELHEPLLQHFAATPAVEVIVEARSVQRRGERDRRALKQSGSTDDRRRVRAELGRRVADRRAMAFAVTPPPLPPALARFARHLVFVERIEPSAQEAEDRSTARLIARFQAGERELFSDLYLRYFDRVYRYLRIAMRDEHEAEDVAQTVFVKVFRGLSRYERRVGVPFRAWLFRIARNEVIDELHREGRLVAEAPDVIDRLRHVGTEAIEERVFDWITDRELGLFVERLPLAQRQVLVLRFMVGMTPEETASVVGRSVTDVRTLQYRALQFLRARLAAVGREPRGGNRASWRRPQRQAQVLRNRRFALLGN